jgi:transcriptional regulator with XRE-family HTH domain
VNKNDFPNRLKQLRKQNNLSQSQLAKLVNLHYNHIGRYERGQSRPTSDALSRLAEALNVSTDYLIDGTEVEAAKASFNDRELLKQFQDVEQLPEKDKFLIKEFLDAFLTKKKIQSLVK